MGLEVVVFAGDLKGGMRCTEGYVEEEGGGVMFSNEPNGLLGDHRRQIPVAYPIL